MYEGNLFFVVEMGIKANILVQTNTRHSNNKCFLNMNILLRLIKKDT